MKIKKIKKPEIHYYDCGYYVESGEISKKGTQCNPGTIFIDPEVNHIYYQSHDHWNNDGMIILRHATNEELAEAIPWRFGMYKKK